MNTLGGTISASAWADWVKPRETSFRTAGLPNASLKGKLLNQWVQSQFGH